MNKQPVSKKRMQVENCDNCGCFTPRLYQREEEGFISLLCPTCNEEAAVEGVLEAERGFEDSGDCDHCGNNVALSDLWAITWDDIQHAMYWLCPACTSKLKTSKEERNNVRQEVLAKTGHRAGKVDTPVQLSFPWDLTNMAKHRLALEAEEQFELERETSKKTRR